MNEVTFVKYRWEHPLKQRYYIAYLGHDLFGWCLTRAWGRKGSAMGQVKHYPVSHYQTGLRLLTSLKKERHKRGQELLTESRMGQGNL